MPLSRRKGLRYSHRFTESGFRAGLAFPVRGQRGPGHSPVLSPGPDVTRGMEVRTPKRVYSPAAIEFWFEKLGAEWEPHFPREALDQARDVYRNGDVAEIEMDCGSAIIRGRPTRDEFYAVIDWEGGVPQVRHSRPEPIRGLVLAAAGLYEIEELLADQIEAITAWEGNSAEVSSLAGTPASGEGSSIPAQADYDSAGARTLQVRLRTEGQGISIRACWETADGSLQPALRGGVDPLPGEQLTLADREKVIQLTTQARRAGFRFDGQRGVLWLDDLRSLAGFAREILPKWRRSFEVESDATIGCLERGIQEARVKARPLQAGSNGGMRVDWQVLVGREELDFPAIRRLASQPDSLHLVPRIGLVTVSEREQRTLRDWQAATRGEAARELPRYMLFSLFGSGLEMELDPAIAQWRDSIENAAAEGAGRSHGRYSFLRDYQRRGVDWLKHLHEHDCHPLLADEMGLGKTLQAAVLIEETLGPVEEALVVCPASVVAVWQQELERFLPRLRVRVLTSREPFREAERGGVWLASYTQVRRHRPLLGDRSFALAVLDEGQFIKNPEAKATQACLAIQARRRLVLTGTPLENRPLDLWTLFRFLMPGLLGSRRAFERACRDRPDQVRARLKAQVAPFILRRTKREVATELPERIEAVLPSPMTPVQEQLYQRLAQEGLAALGEDVEALLQRHSGQLFTLITRLRQVCCDASLLPGQREIRHPSGKILALVEKLEELLAGGGKAVLFSQFVMFLDRVEGVLRERFPDIPRVRLTGSTRDRAAPVRRFTSIKGPALMLASLRAGGVGLNLQAAEAVFLLDPWWNPAVEAQALDRVHRLGQKRTVLAYRLITPGSIEERVESFKQEKRELFADTVGALDDASVLRNFRASLGELLAVDGSRGDSGGFSSPAPAPRGRPRPRSPVREPEQHQPTAG